MKINDNEAKILNTLLVLFYGDGISGGVSRTRKQRQRLDLKKWSLFAGKESRLGVRFATGVLPWEVGK